MGRTVRRGLGLALAMALTLGGERAEAQLTLLNGVGYGALGAAAGGLATAGAECTGFVCIPAETVAAVLGGAVLGVTLGVIAGRGAEAAVDRGEPVGHVWAVSLGAVLGGATAGLITAAVLVGGTGDETGAGTLLGSDEQTIALLSLAGAGLGVVYLRSRWHELSGRAVEVRPALFGHDLGVSARLRF